jgi:hypothetical protein
MATILRNRNPHPVSPCCFAFVQVWLILGMAVNGCAGQSETVYPPNQGAGGAAGQVTYWPVVLDAAEGQIEIYQPQPEAMKGDLLTARSAVSLTRPATTQPVFGTASFTAHVDTDRDTRTATIHEVTVKDVRVPGSTAPEQEAFGRAIGGRLSAMEVTFPLDQLTTSLDTAKEEQTEAAKIQTTPPHILFSTTPATLISVNGAPKLQPMEGRPGVSRVANTPFILLSDDAGKRYYLKAGTRWVSAAGLPGPWEDTANVPPAIAAAGADLAAPATQPSAVAGAAAASAPAVPAAAELAPGAADAKIIVVSEPTELIVTTGNPQFTPVPGSAGGLLLYATNTASDLFLDQSDERNYVLLSGRWYSAGSLQGPWQYIAADHLPGAFAQIPTDSPKADVLPFVAGTTQAREAVLDASIPQTASIRRDAGADLNVAYDGDAKFQDVPESPGVAYAQNTPEDVLRVGGKYYCCHQAVWYESAAATGPWTVCVSVPQAIYTLPPSCPAYHVRYVNVYNYYPDYVTCGYLPGYTGTYVYGPTIVYGTGYDYPGWYGTAYFPPPCTWGYGAYYDPYASAWGFDVGLFWGGFGWFGRPFHDRWWRDHPGERWGWHRWWGPGGFAHSHDLRGHLVDARGHGVFRGGEIGRGGLEARMPGGDQHGQGWNNLYSRNGNMGRNISGARLRSFTPAKVVNGQRDNVFAGSDGHVFRRSGSGWEEQRGGGAAWSGMNRVPEARPSYHPAPAPIRSSGGFARPEAGLDQHFAARSEGAMRSGPAPSFSRGGGGVGGGFRGGGGGGRGGGGGGGHR